MKLNTFYQFKIIIIATLLSIDILCFTTEFENRMKERINISEAFMKHRKSQTQTNGMFKTNDQSSVSANNHSEYFAEKKQNPKDFGIANPEVFNNGSNDITSSMDPEFGLGPIYVTGWIKYFKYHTTSQTKQGQKQNPKTFIVNGQFNEQLKILANSKLNEKSSDGLNLLNTNIKNKFMFYAVLLKNRFNILSSRQAQTQKTFDSIDISQIGNIPEIGGFPRGSGIEDFGNFSEGFCFKINVIAFSADTYVICCEDLKTKSDLMTYIKKMKMSLQRQNGNVMMPVDIKAKEQMTIVGMLNQSAQFRKGRNGNLSSESKMEKLVDGYWIVLQNWSQCTLKCGGGKSYLHRMCVSPKDGGKECEGNAIIERDCNMQPCPEVKKTIELMEKNTKVLKPVIKIMAFSSRPQRYSKCVIKETDMFYTKNFDEKDSMMIGSKPKEIEQIKIPVRVVMNNRTITVFSGEDYDTHVQTLILKKTTLEFDQKNEGCFFLREVQTVKAHLCPFSDPKKSVQEWEYDFNLFKYQCNYQKPEYIVDEFRKKLSDKISEVKKSLLDETQQQMKRKAQETEEKKLESTIKRTNKVALQAIQKELNLEELIKQEEIDREKREEQMMLRKIEEEKRKSDCLMRAIREKQLENQYNIKQVETAEAIQNIKRAAIQEVQTRRNSLKKMITDMRSKQKRKTNSLSQKLQAVRYEMAKQMGKAYKKGDPSNCEKIQKGVEDEQRKEMRKHYCVANFAEDFVNYQNCLEGDDFCHMCCDNEFGEFYVGEREKCYKMACNGKLIELAKGENGRWVWQNELAAN